MKAKFLFSNVILVVMTFLGTSAVSATKEFIWTERDLAVYCTGDIDFLDDKFGGNVCAEYFYTTIDGGRTWDIKKVFEKNGRPWGLHVEGLKILSKTEILISGTYVYTDADNVTQNEIVIARSFDGGNTFTETLLDTYQGKEIYGTEIEFHGVVGAFSRLDGSAVYYTKDGGQSWKKTEPSGGNVKSKISVLADGSLKIARTERGEVQICTLDVMGTEQWKCEKTMLSTSKLNSGPMVIGLDFFDQNNGIIAFGLENSVFGGLFSTNRFLPNFNYSGSCYDVRYIDAQNLIATCLNIDTSGAFGPEENIDFIVSHDGGTTWAKKYSARHPYMTSVHFETHLLSDGTTEVFLTDAQRFRIGTIH